MVCVGLTGPHKAHNELSRTPVCTQRLTGYWTPQVLHSAGSPQKGGCYRRLRVHWSIVASAVWEQQRCIVGPCDCTWKPHRVSKHLTTSNVCSRPDAMKIETSRSHLQIVTFCIRVQVGLQIKARLLTRSRFRLSRHFLMKS